MSQQAVESDTIDLANVARTLRRGWGLIAVAGAVGLGLGVAFQLLAPRRFDGHASILLRAGSSERASLLAQVQGLSGGLLSGVGGSSEFDTEVSILSSRAVAGAVVDSLRLQASVRHPHGVPATAVVASLDAPASFAPATYHFERIAGGSAAAETQPRFRYSSKLDTGTAVAGLPAKLAVGAITLANGPGLPASFDLRILDREDAIANLLDHLSVDAGKGELAQLTYGARDSATAAAVPNAIVATYMARRHTTDRGVDERRVEFLTGKLDSLNGALARNEIEFKNQQEASGVLDPQTAGKLEVERASGLRDNLLELQVEGSAARRLIDGVANHTMSGRQLAAFPTFLKSPGISSVLTQLMDVQSSRDALLGTRTAKDPQVLALDQSAQDLERQLLPLTETYAASIEAQVKQKQAALDTLQGAIATLPATSLAAGRLQRDVLNLSKLAAGVQVQLVDAKLGAIAEGGDVHPLDVATMPRLPAFPKPVLTLTAGALGGLGLGAIAVLLLAAFGRWLRDPVDVERTTGVPTLRFDPAAPLLVRGAGLQTILVAPVEQGTSIGPVVDRLRVTAIASGLSAAVLDLTGVAGPRSGATAVERRTSPESRESAARGDVNNEIRRLGADHDLVIVQLAGLFTDTAAAALRDSRPVLLVTTDRRVERSRLRGAVELLKRLDVPCAGVVMNGVADSAPRLAELPA